MYIVLSVFAKVLMEMTDEVVWLFSLLKDSPLKVPALYDYKPAYGFNTDTSAPVFDTTGSSLCLRVRVA